MLNAELNLAFAICIQNSRAILSTFFARRRTQSLAQFPLFAKLMLIVNSNRSLSTLFRDTRSTTVDQTTDLEFPCRTMGSIKPWNHGRSRLGKIKDEIVAHAFSKDRNIIHIVISNTLFRASNYSECIYCPFPIYVYVMHILKKIFLYFVFLHYC